MNWFTHVQAHKVEEIKQHQEIMKLLKRAVFAFIILICVVIIAEVALRILAPQYQRFVALDPKFGYVLKPNAPYIIFPAERCVGWGASGVLNSQGLRDDEVDFDKPENTFRIIVIGNSYTEGFQFQRGEIWPDLLESLLNENSTNNVTYEVINAGRSSMSTSVAAMWYEEYGQQYDADMVLVLFTSRDFINNSPKLSQYSYPYLVLEDDKLVIDNQFQNTRSYKIDEILYPLRDALYIAEFGTVMLSTILDGGDSQPENSPDLAEKPILTQDERIHAQRPAAQQEAIELTGRVLAKFDEDVRQNGSEFVLVHASNKNQVQSEFEEVWNTSTDYRVISNEILQDIATTYDITYLDLVPILRQYAAENNVLVHGCEENNGGGHWNQPTHQFVAETMTNYLLQQNLLPES